jgi:hypothetical protein
LPPATEFLFTEDDDYIDNEAMQGDDANEDDDEDEEPARDDPAPAGGRVRRVSEKQAQLCMSSWHDFLIIMLMPSS